MARRQSKDSTPRTALPKTTQSRNCYPTINHCEGESPVDKTARQGQCVNTALSQQRSMPMIIRASLAKENSPVARRQGQDSTPCTALPKTTQSRNCYPSNKSITKQPSMQTDYYTAPHRTRSPRAGFRGSRVRRYRRRAARGSGRRHGLSKDGGR